MTEKYLTEKYLPLDAEPPRLSNHYQWELNRLRVSRGTNAKLAALIRKHTGPRSDIGKAGYRIEVVARCQRTGWRVYALRRKPSEARSEK